MPTNFDRKCYGNRFLMKVWVEKCQKCIKEVGIFIKIQIYWQSFVEEVLSAKYSWYCQNKCEDGSCQKKNMVRQNHVSTVQGE